MADTDRMRGWPSPCLMMVTDRQRLRGRRLEDVARLAAEGGVNVVQLREKDLPGGELLNLASSLGRALSGRSLLLVNDRADVALAAGADGVHLPEHGLATTAVREIVGDGRIVGRSVHDVEGAERAEQEGVDFVLAGTVYATASKPEAPPAGVELVREIATAVSVPVVGIGGITAEYAGDVVRAGAQGVAVIGAILDAEDPLHAARSLRRAMGCASAG